MVQLLATCSPTSTVVQLSSQMTSSGVGGQIFVGSWETCIGVAGGLQRDLGSGFVLPAVISKSSFTSTPPMLVRVTRRGVPRRVTDILFSDESRIFGCGVSRRVSFLVLRGVSHFILFTADADLSCWASSSPLRGVHKARLCMRRLRLLLLPSSSSISSKSFIHGIGDRICESSMLSSWMLGKPCAVSLKVESGLADFNSAFCCLLTLDDFRGVTFGVEGQLSS